MSKTPLYCHKNARSLLKKILIKKKGHTIQETTTTMKNSKSKRPVRKGEKVFWEEEAGERVTHASP